MHTVDYTNFFDFGVDTGDDQLIADLPSRFVFAGIPILFFERSQLSFNVSQLCIYAFTRILG